MLSTFRHVLPLRLPAEWPYWAGGVALAIVNTLVLALYGKPWSFTSLLANVGAKLVQLAGAAPENWAYFQIPERAASLAQFGLLDHVLWLNLGIMAGALVSTLLAGEFRWRPIRNRKTIVLALTGGVLLGYGARLALGCNAGALSGGIPALSLHGWVFALFLFAGMIAGIRLFRRVL